MRFDLPCFVLGAAGGALPDVLRIVKGRFDPASLRFLATWQFWAGFVLLMGLGGLAAFLVQADSVTPALSVGFAAPEVLSGLVGGVSRTSEDWHPRRGIDLQAPPRQAGVPASTHVAVPMRNRPPEKKREGAGEVKEKAAPAAEKACEKTSQPEADWERIKEGPDEAKERAARLRAWVKALEETKEAKEETVLSVGPDGVEEITARVRAALRPLERTEHVAWDVGERAALSVGGRQRMIERAASAPRVRSLLDWWST